MYGMAWYVCDQLLSARRVSISFFLLLIFFCCLLSFVSLDTKIERRKKTHHQQQQRVKKSEGKTKTYENDVITDSIAKT